MSPDSSKRSTRSSAPATVASAMKRRAVLLADSGLDAARLINGAADGFEGLVVERLGNVLVAQLHEGRLNTNEGDVRTACEQLLQETGAAAVYRKVFPKGRSAAQAETDAANRDPKPWLAAAGSPPIPEEFAVSELGLQFLVRPYDGFSYGLFLEQRDNRKRVREAAAGRRVLNTFSYTCAFGVAAGVGGAELVVNVDVSKRYLEWGKRNLAANGLALEKQIFICSDVFDYYKRAKRQGRRFDLVILDPPTFSRCRAGKAAFVLKDELDALVGGALELLDPGGVILLCTNQREATLARLEKSLHVSAADRRVTIFDRPALPPDFAGDKDYAKSVWARFD